MPGPIDEELTERGCQDLGGGWWTHPGYEGGQRRMGWQEAIAWTLQGERERLRALTEKLGDQEKLEKRIEWFQQQMDQIRQALGLSCTYSEMVAATRHMVEQQRFVRIGSYELKPEDQERILRFLNETREGGTPVRIEDPDKSDTEERIASLAAKVNNLLQRMKPVETDLAGHEQTVGALRDYVVRCYHTARSVLPAMTPLEQQALRTGERR